MFAVWPQGGGTHSGVIMMAVTGRVQNDGQTPSCGLWGVDWEGSPTDARPSALCGTFYSVPLPAVGPLSRFLKIGRGDESPLWHKKRPTERKRRSTNTILGQGVHRHHVKGAAPPRGWRRAACPRPVALKMAGSSPYIWGCLQEEGRGGGYSWFPAMFGLFTRDGWGIGDVVGG